MKCVSNAPTTSCPDKSAVAPRDGFYWVRYHTCECCAGPEIVQLEGGAIWDGRGWIDWADFNGHALHDEPLRPPTSVVEGFVGIPGSGDMDGASPAELYLDELTRRPE